MSKFNKHQSDRERFGKCQICLGYIPVEYYFSKGDEIICYECGTEYIVASKNPVKLEMIGDNFETEEYFNEMIFDDH